MVILWQNIVFKLLDGVHKLWKAIDSVKRDLTLVLKFLRKFLIVHFVFFCWIQTLCFLIWQYHILIHQISNNLQQIDRTFVITNLHKSYHRLIKNVTFTDAANPRNTVDRNNLSFKFFISFLNIFYFKWIS